ncbi:hypothetical protein, partial [Myxococcus sp. AM011]|uniref:hypothetical protein n=1 Tax=Myxococcus sp. AM011 TaxID=2745200 RepID=UPI001C3CF7F4
QRSLAGAFSKIDCGFRNPSLLLGLAIWFSKTEPLVSTATSCYRCFCLLLATSCRRVASFIQVRVSCQLRFASLSASSEVLSAAQWLPLFLRRGRGFYLSAAYRVNRCFVDSLAASALLLPGFFVGGAASITAASSVNSLR